MKNKRRNKQSKLLVIDAKLVAFKIEEVVPKLTKIPIMTIENLEVLNECIDIQEINSEESKHKSIS